MSDYETKAWSSLLDTERKRRNSAKGRATDKVSAVVKRAGEHIKKVPGAELALELGDETIVKAVEGLFKSAFLPAMQSPSLDKRIAELRGKHQDMDIASLFTSLDLKELDKGRPTFAIPFIGMAGSAATSLTITGLTVGENVSDGPSAEVVLGAVVADVGATLVLLGRAVGEVAVHYGYDPREPEEELFLMGVLNYSMASTATSKTAALASLSRLTQSMMRRATWNELRKDSLVQVLMRVFSALGLKLTKAQLARFVPIAGALLTAGLSFNLLHSTIGDATRLYRARYLAEKHGLSLNEWLTAREREAGVTDDATVVEVDGAIREITAF
ncbi:MULTISPECIES: EcsC family protein [Micromonospora]|nr:MULTISPECIES: EcsC family protein [unclassified Micromonospora]MCK1830585.1 EcsC family protein [Micromonospora sp. R42003]MCK1842145.1 EcsC family protein [Micromonospora sp. R42004]MCM1015403.1 EcsC family protein [Micromonospora sp. XM-20-01]